MRMMGGIADIATGGAYAGQFVSDFGVVEIPPKLRAELERIDAHLVRQKARLAEQFAAYAPLAMEDLDDAQAQAA